MMLSENFLKVGGRIAFAPFIQDVCEAYHLAPIQINPNSYRSMITSYIIYYKKGFHTLDANTLSYFLRLNKFSKRDFGYVYFFVWPEVNGKNLVFGKPSNVGSWKIHFSISMTSCGSRPHLIIIQVAKRTTHHFLCIFFLHCFPFLTSFLASQLLQRELFSKELRREMRTTLLVFLATKGILGGSYPPPT